MRSGTRGHIGLYRRTGGRPEGRTLDLRQCRPGVLRCRTDGRLGRMGGRPSVVIRSLEATSTDMPDRDGLAVARQCRSMSSTRRPKAARRLEVPPRLEGGPSLEVFPRPEAARCPQVTPSPGVTRSLEPPSTDTLHRLQVARRRRTAIRGHGPRNTRRNELEPEIEDKDVDS